MLDFSAARTFSKRRHRLFPVLVKLQDREKVLRSVIQGKRSGKIVAEDDKDDGHEHHHALLRGSPLFGVRRIIQKLVAAMMQRKNIDRPSHNRKMRHRVGLGEVLNPQETARPAIRPPAAAW